VVTTRPSVADIDDREAIGAAYGEIFGEIRPASTMAEVSGLVDDDAVIEIEAEAVVSALWGVRLSSGGIRVAARRAFSRNRVSAVLTLLTRKPCSCRRPHLSKPLHRDRYGTDSGLTPRPESPHLARSELMIRLAPTSRESPHLARF
jgi:hypothetical protein